MQEIPVRFLGQRRSPGEGIGYPLQYLWASLGAQMVKNLPAMQKAWAWFPGWEESWRGHGNPLQYSCLENPHGQRSLAVCSPWAHKESDMIERLSAQHMYLSIYVFKVCIHIYVFSYIYICTHTNIYIYIYLSLANCSIFEYIKPAVLMRIREGCHCRLSQCSFTLCSVIELTT